MKPSTKINLALTIAGAIALASLVGCGGNAALELQPQDAVTEHPPAATPSSPDLVGRWVSQTTGEVEDVKADGSFSHVPALGILGDDGCRPSAVGTWTLQDGHLVTRIGGTSVQRIVAETATELTLEPGGVYLRTQSSQLTGGIWSTSTITPTTWYHRTLTFATDGTLIDRQVTINDTTGTSVHEYVGTWSADATTLTITEPHLRQIRPYTLTLGAQQADASLVICGDSYWSGL